MLFDAGEVMLFVSDVIVMFKRLDRQLLIYLLFTTIINELIYGDCVS